MLIYKDVLNYGEIIIDKECFTHLIKKASPDYMLVISLMEIKSHADKVLKAWQGDPHVPIILRASAGRYTHLIFSSFCRMKDHLKWEEDYDQRFSGCIGAVKNKYLSPSMMFSIAQQYVSLEVIKRKLNQIRGKELVDMMKPSKKTTTREEE